MAMRSTVLIGFADALAGIESAWCLAEDGFEVHAFARRGSRPTLARARCVRVIEVTRPEDDAPACAAELATIARNIGAAVLLPLDDHAVWLCDRALRPNGQAVVAGPTGRLATLALDKREQLLLAGSAGLAVPPTADIDAPRSWPGPRMVKPALAVELRGDRLQRAVGRIAAGPEQVTEIASAIGGPVLVQPLINGLGEGIFGLAVGGAAAALSGHRRVRMMNPRGSGSSACRPVPVSADVTGPVRDMIARSGWHGLFMVELLRDTAGKPWFMELNGRAWGSMALARYCGHRYPTWAVQAALERQFVPPEPTPPPEITARHLGREIVHLATVLARGGAPRLATVRDVLTVRRSDRWYNYRPGEAGILIADTWATVRGQVTARVSRSRLATRDR
jgi:hypothetical protein